MNRLVALLLALAVVAAACGGAADSGTTEVGAADPTTTSPTESTEASDSTGSTEGPDTTEGMVEPPVSGVDGPPAPPDPVPYEGGNDILLSQEVLPVYLVFWAEW